MGKHNFVTFLQMVKLYQNKTENILNVVFNKDKMK